MSRRGAGGGEGERPEADRPGAERSEAALAEPAEGEPAEAEQALSSRPEVSGFAATPEPPYYAVVFTAQRTAGDAGYAAMAARMEELALARPGCLGVESARGADGLGITVSYWRDEPSLIAWRADAEHLVAQRLGRERWYSHYALRVARVERDYTGPEGRAA